MKSRVMTKILNFDLGDEEGPLKGFEVLSSCIGIKNGLEKTLETKRPTLRLVSKDGVKDGLGQSISPGMGKTGY